MKIQFDKQMELDTEKLPAAKNAAASVTGKVGNSPVITDFSGTAAVDGDAYGVQGKTAEDIAREASLTDVDMQRNYMAVMSSFMSEEDFSEMLREGANPGDTDIETAVTIVDRIKAELLKSGVHVEGYTDSLDRKTVARIVGSESFASELTEAFHEKDIPVTEENVREAAAAVERALELQKPSEGGIKYMVGNAMKPTVENLYRAQYSGAQDADRQGRGYYREENGYYAKKAEMPDFQKLGSQIREIIKDAGIEETGEAVKGAEWLVKKGVPLTPQSIVSYQEVTALSLPLEEEQAVRSVTAAMENGQKPMQADVRNFEGKYEKAQKMPIHLEKLLSDSTISLTAKKQLEEARILMSAEVNLRMAEKGISLDLNKMEEVLEKLRETEREQAKKLFPDQREETAVEQFHLYHETLDKTELLPKLPAAVLGKLVFKSSRPLTVGSLTEEGTKLQKSFEKAHKAYETLMTAPRKDLGDRIQKAFQNVDDILEDLNFELSYENERAVRILSYNQIAITKENVEKIRKEDRKLGRVMQKMTPASVLQMIRDGVNPLDTEMSDLEEYFDTRDQNPEKQMETYSRYLQRLEKNKEITPEEREAYIGVYRLLRQIEKSDGAVIGSVLKANSTLNFRQLLAASRTAKKAGMNLLVDECFGGVSALKTENEKIDEQIAKIDQQCLREEFRSADRELKNARNMDREENVIEFLNRLDFPVTINHILAGSSLMKNGNSMFRTLKEKKKDEKKDVLSNLTDGLLKAMTDRDSFQKEYDRFSEKLQNRLVSASQDSENTSLDIKAIKNSYIQLQIARRLTREETYEIPVSLGEEVVAVRLKVQHRGDEKGRIELTFTSEKSGKVDIEVNIQKENVEIYVTGEEKQTAELEKLQNKIKNRIKNKHNTTSRALYNISRDILGELMSVQ